MANKFTKSVLERQAKEMRQHPARAAKPAGEGEAVPQETPVQSAQSTQPAQPDAPAAATTGPTPAAEPAAPAADAQDSPAPETAPAEQVPVSQPTPRARAAKTAKASAVPVDLAEFIVRDEGRIAKNKTFYLDAAVIDALHRAAVAQKVTDSKLVNDILKKILGV